MCIKMILFFIPILFLIFQLTLAGTGSNHINELLDLVTQERDISNVNDNSPDAGYLDATFVGDGIEIMFQSKLTHQPFGSMLSFHTRNDEGRCNIHILNITEELKIGTYEIGAKDGINVATVCFLENSEQQERIISHSGKLTISDVVNGRILVGDFDIKLRGQNTGKRYSFSGKFSAPPD